MKGKSTVLWIAVAALVLPQAAWATYSSIQHNLVDGVSDTAFDASTGKLTWDSTSPSLTLNDDALPPGSPSNVLVHLETTLTGYNPATQEATFHGGSYLLQFDYAGTTGQTYAIGGPIAGAIMKVNSTSQALSTIKGEGLFTASTKNLPGSNDWPATGLSSISSLTLAIGTDLSAFAWNASISGSGNNVETIYSLLPNPSAAPEPASMLLLLAGTAFFARRRR